MLTLENNKIKLRAIEPSDIDTLYDWENNQEIWQVSNTITPFSKYVLARYIKNAQLDIYQSKQLRLMIDVKDKTGFISAGMIDVFDFDPFHLRAGLGIYINENFRKSGIASSALELTIKYCFINLGLHQLYCNITSDNEVSLSLFKKHGFEIAGVKKDWIKGLDKWEDEFLLQLINLNK